MQLIDKTTGDYVDVPDDQAQAAFQSGQYGVEAGQRVPVKLADGRVGTVKAEDLGSTLSKGGSLATPEEHAAAQAAKAEAAKQEQYGAGLGSLHALQQMQNTAAEGVARGLSLGLSDPLTLDIAERIGGPAAREKIRKDMEARKSANPWISTGTELGGAIAPMVIPGGQAGAVGKAAQLAAKGGEALELARLAGEGAEVAKAASAGSEAVKAATALPRALDFAGGIAERAAKAVVGEGSANTLARMVQKGVASGARGAVEGALYGVGSQVSEDTLGDHNITGEKLAAALGHGALMGGLIGGAGGAGIEGLSTGAKALAKVAAPAAKGAAEEMAVKALNPRKLFEGKIEDLPGGARALGRDLLDMGLVKPGDNVEHIAPRITAAVDDVGSRIGKVADDIDAKGLAAQHMPTVEEIGAKLRAAADKEFKGLTSVHSSNYAAIDNVIADMEAKFGGPQGQPTLGGLRELRGMIDGRINWNSPDATGYKIARRALEDEAETVIDKAAPKMGGDIFAEYKSAKALYRKLSVARDAVDDAVTRKGANASLSLTDKMLATGQMAGGLASGIGAPLAMAKGLVVGTGSKIVRERGASTAATFLDKIAELGALSKTVDAVDARAESAMSRFMEGKPTEYASLKTASKAERDARYEAAAKRIKAAVTSPAEHSDAIAHGLGAIVQHAPKMASVATQTAARASVYLSSRLPQTPPSRTIQPQFDKYDPPAADKEKFLRCVRAADDPLSIIDDMSRGRLTRDGVQTVKEVYPGLYKELQQMAMQKAVDAKKPLNYNQKLQLGLLLEVPTDATLQPDFIKAMQDTFAEQGGGAPPTGGKMPGPPKRPLEGIADTTQLGRGRSDK